MGGIPNTLQCSHGLSGGSDAFFDVVVFTQAEGNEGTEIFEVSAVGDIAIFDGYGLGFIQFIIQLLFSFPACSFLLFRLTLQYNRARPLVISARELIINAPSST